MQTILGITLTLLLCQAVAAQTKPDKKPADKMGGLLLLSPDYKVIPLTGRHGAYIVTRFAVFYLVENKYVQVTEADSIESLMGERDAGSYFSNPRSPYYVPPQSVSGTPNKQSPVKDIVLPLYPPGPPYQNFIPAVPDRNTGDRRITRQQVGGTASKKAAEQLAKSPRRTAMPQ